MKRFAFLITLLLSFTLIACGQTGRLYLPKKAVLMTNPRGNNITTPPPQSTGVPV